MRRGCEKSNRSGAHFLDEKMRRGNYRINEDGRRGRKENEEEGRNECISFSIFHRTRRGLVRNRQSRRERELETASNSQTNRAFDREWSLYGWSKLKGGRDRRGEVRWIKCVKLYSGRNQEMHLKNHEPYQEIGRKLKRLVDSSFCHWLMMGGIQ